MARIPRLIVRAPGRSGASLQPPHLDGGAGGIMDRGAHNHRAPGLLGLVAGVAIGVTSGVMAQDSAALVPLLNEIISTGKENMIEQTKAMVGLQDAEQKNDDQNTNREVTATGMAADSQMNQERKFHLFDLRRSMAVDPATCGDEATQEVQQEGEARSEEDKDDAEEENNETVGNSEDAGRDKLGDAILEEKGDNETGYSGTDSSDPDNLGENPLDEETYEKVTNGIGARARQTPLPDLNESQEKTQAGKEYALQRHAEQADLELVRNVETEAAAESKVIDGAADHVADTMKDYPGAIEVMKQVSTEGPDELGEVGNSQMLEYKATWRSRSPRWKEAQADASKTPPLLKEQNEMIAIQMELLHQNLKQARETNLLLARLLRRQVQDPDNQQQMREHHRRAVRGNM